jgi:hypothetical protein
VTVIDTQFHIPGLTLETRPEAGMYVVTSRPIPAGTIVVAWSGPVVDREVFATFDHHVRSHSVQVADDLFLIPPDPLELVDYVNHSCDPTCGMLGSQMLVSMRPLAAGDEISFDYAMCDTDPYDEFTCACESENCRGQVTATDWMLPELQARYDGYFSAYIQRRLDALRAGSFSMAGNGVS